MPALERISPEGEPKARWRGEAGPRIRLLMGASRERDFLGNERCVRFRRDLRFRRSEFISIFISTRVRAQRQHMRTNTSLLVSGGGRNRTHQRSFDRSPVLKSLHLRPDDCDGVRPNRVCARQRQCSFRVRASWFGLMRPIPAASGARLGATRPRAPLLTAGVGGGPGHHPRGRLTVTWMKPAHPLVDRLRKPR